MPDRYPSPGPSARPELPLPGGGARVGMAPSGSTDDGWWFTVLWVVDDGGALGFQELGFDVTVVDRLEGDMLGPGGEDAQPLIRQQPGPRDGER